MPIQSFKFEIHGKVQGAKSVLIDVRYLQAALSPPPLLSRRILQKIYRGQGAGTGPRRVLRKHGARPSRFPVQSPRRSSVRAHSACCRLATSSHAATRRAHLADPSPPWNTQSHGTVIGEAQGEPSKMAEMCVAAPSPHTSCACTLLPRTLGGSRLSVLSVRALNRGGTLVGS